MNRIVLLLSVIAVTLSAAPVHAGGDSTCPDNRLCFYVDIEFEGNEKVVRARVGKYNLKGDWNNLVSSIDNNTSKTVLLYEDKNAGGERICVAPDSEEEDLTLIDFNDSISSYKVTRNDACLI